MIEWLMRRIPKLNKRNLLEYDLGSIYQYLKYSQLQLQMQILRLDRYWLATNQYTYIPSYGVY